MMPKTSQMTILHVYMHTELYLMQENDGYNVMKYHDVRWYDML